MFSPLKYVFLLMLASCAPSINDPPNLAVAPTDLNKYHSDLAVCKKWAEPTNKEYWSRQAGGSSPAVSLFANSMALGDNDPRNKAIGRAGCYGNGHCLLDQCLRNKGYKLTASPNDTPVTVP